MQLHNKYGKTDLLKQLEAEEFNRKTLSFYRYVNIADPQAFRDMLYQKWDELGCKGRIYVAKEGINAQMNFPEPHEEAFFTLMNGCPELQNMPIKWAVQEDNLSFLKLTIKVKHKIVADGLEDGSFDTTNVGTHLSPMEFHEMVSDTDNIVVDMRNHYESEIGHFENAFCPDVDTFREEIDLVVDKYKDEKNKKFLLYCTGGVRCEKASAYMKHKGFEDVNQLHGGIIAYADEIKKQGVPSKFKGKNFVFDERLAESIGDEVISSCHQCGKPCDSHTNCANTECHLLFIQCPECKERMENCCTPECIEISKMSKAELQKLRVQNDQVLSKNRTYKSRLRPNLRQQS